MSLETWKKEFCPYKADSKKVQEDAISYTLQKWIGLRKKNLKKHGIVDVSNLPGVNNSCYSCAISIKYHCNGCPLFLARGVRCDISKMSKNKRRVCIAPYTYWTVKNNPEPMIAALEKAKKKEIQK